MINYQKLANDDIGESLSTHNVLPEFKNMDVADRKAACDGDRLPFKVAILNVTGELNTGTIIRNSLLMGAQEVLVIGRRKIDKRGTVGSENYINVERIDAMLDETTIDCKKVAQIFRSKKLWPIYVEQGGTNIPDFKWTYHFTGVYGSGLTPVLVFGNENRGIPDDLLNMNMELNVIPDINNDDRFGDIVSVKQRGVVRSYNVGVTSGMVMMDMVNQMEWWPE